MLKMFRIFHCQLLYGIKKKYSVCGFYLLSIILEETDVTANQIQWIIVEIPFQGFISKHTTENEILIIFLGVPFTPFTIT